MQNIITIFNLRKLSKLCDKVCYNYKSFQVYVLLLKPHKSKDMPNVLKCP